MLLLFFFVKYQFYLLDYSITSQWTDNFIVPANRENGLVILLCLQIGKKLTNNFTVPADRKYGLIILLCLQIGKKLT